MPKNLTVVADCANGAAFEAGPEMLSRLGLRVISINNIPNGLNINENCGSTYTEGLKRSVVQHQADLGVAFDGDADRCIIIDEQGQELDGDYIMTICALNMKRTGILKPPGVVATVMSNIGLDIALKRENIVVNPCKVGDRYVLEKMKESGYMIGGEQSGHIIFLDHATTGDGLLTSLKVIEVMKRTGLKLSELAQEMEKQPQILVNLRIENKDEVLNHALVLEALQRSEQRLGERGKMVVRPSGTEPLVRIMAQGPEQQLLEEVIDDIKKAIEIAVAPK